MKSRGTLLVYAWIGALLALLACLRWGGLLRTGTPVAGMFLAATCLILLKTRRGSTLYAPVLCLVLGGACSTLTVTLAS